MDVNFRMLILILVDVNFECVHMCSIAGETGFHCRSCVITTDCNLGQLWVCLWPYFKFVVHISVVLRWVSIDMQGNTAKSLSRLFLNECCSGAYDFTCCTRSRKTACQGLTIVLAYSIIESRKIVHYGRFGSNLCNWLEGMIVSSGSCAAAPVITTQWHSMLEQFSENVLSGISLNVSI